MNYLTKALIEYLSGLTTMKNEKEIYTRNEFTHLLTVEPIDDECYILREYRNNGNLWWEHRLKNDQRHGICKGWNSEGKVMYEVLWENGKYIKDIE